MEIDNNMKCLKSYLESLALNEPFQGSSPIEKRLWEDKNNALFVRTLTENREEVGRCSDDFRYFEFNDASHEKLLPPVCIALSETSGRFLKATRDIEAGETVFWECPVVMAPKGGSGPTCLNCFLSLDETNWPICDNCKSPRCKECCNGNEHSSLECSILASAFEGKDLTTNITLVRRLNIILTTLRTYIATVESPSIQEVIKALQSNVSQRKESAMSKFIDGYIVPFFKEETKLGVNSDFVHHVCGVFDTNSFEVSLEQQKGQARALLPLAALMNHSCTSNTQHWFLGGHLVVRASVLIRKGEPVTNNYTQALWGTEARIAHITLTKYFSCNCPRCHDSSELGTHISSILCQECKGSGLMLPPKPKSNKQWICIVCGDQMSTTSVLNKIKVASSIVAKAEGMDVETMLKMLRKLKIMLGRQHFTSVKLAFLYVSKAVEKTETAQESILSEVLPLVNYLMEVMSKILPGFTKIRGLLIMCKLKAWTELCRRRLSGTLSDAGIREQSRAQEENWTRDLDTEAEECEDILKWDAILGEIQQTRYFWKAIQENLKTSGNNDK